MADQSRFYKMLLGALLSSMLAAPAVGGQPPAPTALNPLTNDTHSFAVDINNRGEVAGRSIGEFTTAVRWDADGQPTPLFPLTDDADSFGEGINNRGQVIGHSRSSKDDCVFDTALIWDRDGARTALPPLPGDSETRGFAINNNGVAVGISIGDRAPAPSCVAPFTAVMWDRRGNATELPSPSVDLNEGFASDINNNGVVAGFINPSEGFAFAATTWNRRNHPTMLAGPAGSFLYIATRLNDDGVIAGQHVAFPSFAMSALLWDRQGNLLPELPPLAGSSEAFANDINNRGAVAGSSGAGLAGFVFGFSDPSWSSAVTWDKHGIPTALAPLADGEASFGLGNNDPGHVVGHSRDDDTGTNTAVVWR